MLRNQLTYLYDAVAQTLIYKKLLLSASFYLRLAEKTTVTLNIYLIFDKNEHKNQV